ncbi:hypothetical protein B0H34DRAFT_785 [Crassisporium funariophilum]|nr:hypothetical protein B0H34DRAFT_785 [Crassisporium funariophilum]
MNHTHNLPVFPSAEPSICDLSSTQNAPTAFALPNIRSPYSLVSPALSGIIPTPFTLHIPDGVPCAPTSNVSLKRKTLEDRVEGDSSYKRPKQDFAQYSSTFRGALPFAPTPTIRSQRDWQHQLKTNTDMTKLYKFSPEIFRNVPLDIDGLDCFSVSNLNIQLPAISAQMTKVVQVVGGERVESFLPYLFFPPAFKQPVPLLPEDCYRVLAGTSVDRLAGIVQQYGLSRGRFAITVNRHLVYYLTKEQKADILTAAVRLPLLYNVVSAILSNQDPLKLSSLQNPNSWAAVLAQQPLNVASVPLRCSREPQSIDRAVTPTHGQGSMRSASINPILNTITSALENPIQDSCLQHSQQAEDNFVPYADLPSVRPAPVAAPPAHFNTIFIIETGNNTARAHPSTSAPSAPKKRRSKPYARKPRPPKLQEVLRVQSESLEHASPPLQADMGSTSTTNAPFTSAGMDTGYVRLETLDTTEYHQENTNCQEPNASFHPSQDFPDQNTISFGIASAPVHSAVSISSQFDYELADIDVTELLRLPSPLSFHFQEDLQDEAPAYCDASILATLALAADGPSTLKSSQMMYIITRPTIHMSREVKICSIPSWTTTFLL